MRRKEARSRAPLLHMPPVRLENGPSLSMARNVRRATKLQSLCPLPHLPYIILLDVLRYFRELAMGICDHGWTR